MIRPNGEDAVRSNEGITQLALLIDGFVVASSGGSASFNGGASTKERIVYYLLQTARGKWRRFRLPRVTRLMLSLCAITLVACSLTWAIELASPPRQLSFCLLKSCRQLFQGRLEAIVLEKY
jgi:hypothetical protein